MIEKLVFSIPDASLGSMYVEKHQITSVVYKAAGGTNKSLY